MVIKLKDIILAVGIVVIILMLVFKQDKQVFEVPKIVEVEKIIEGKETVIERVQVEIVKESKLIKRLSTQIEQLRIELMEVKQAKDTVKIIEVQDTIIDKLTITNKRLDTTIILRDSVIVDQRYIIESHDTIKQVQEHDIKRLKRQRNVGILITGVVTLITLLR